ncbi:unnamed protein product [Absidia cylindrospora]
MMKVKTPNGSTEDADLLKLTNMLKDAIDSMHANGLTSVGGRMFGVLVEGYRCDLYAMDLDYTFIYRLYKLGTFYIPRNRYDFGCLINLIEHLVTLRRLFDAMVIKCHDEQVDLLRCGVSTPPYLQKTKPSFSSPVRLQ